MSNIPYFTQNSKNFVNIYSNYTLFYIIKNVIPQPLIKIVDIIFIILANKTQSLNYN